MANHIKPIITLGRVFVILLMVTSAACQSPTQVSTPTTPVGNPPTSTPITPTKTPHPAAEVNFNVIVPQGTPNGAAVDLNIVDEVTGLSMNSTTYKMQTEDGQAFSLKVPISLEAVIKYRYSLEGGSIEYTSQNEPVRYRMLEVTGPETIQDTISAWQDTSPVDATGNVTGHVTDAKTGSPLPGVLITLGGQQVLTSSDGSFLVNKLPVGTHNLVAYTLDGSYHPYQQGARIAANLTTPAHLALDPAPRVNITFNLTTPNENVVGLPVRMAGNLLALGNTFSNLVGDLSTISSRMPLMSQQSGGHYSLTLNLPVGTDLEYKYTLGDGFWNAELTADGKFNLRRLVVPDHDLTIEDQVTNWHTPGFGPITINLKAPTDTPAGEMVSIQFKPFGWTEPLPMWPLGNNSYLFILYNPLNFNGALVYRFCRNDQCGSSDQFTLAGDATVKGSFTPLPEAQTFHHEIQAWDDWKAQTKPTSVVAENVNPRGPNFIAGIQFLPATSPDWQPYLGPAIQQLKTIGSNWVLLSPTWSYPENTSPTASLVPGKDPLWQDLVSTINNAHNRGLEVGLYPQVNMPGTARWWLSARRDPTWWQDWFSNYRIFILHHADLASQTGSKALVLGGSWLMPALPSGKLIDGNPSGVPVDAETRWIALIAEVRQHFQGSLLWAADYEDGLASIPDFASQVDMFYLHFSPALIQSTNYTQADLNNSLNLIMDQDVIQIYQSYQKPIILAVDYPSANGSAEGCIQTRDDSCLTFNALDRTNMNRVVGEANLQVQVDLYNALFSAINSRDWIQGVVSTGFYPPVKLQDLSSSVNGKPAMDVLWYWFPPIVSNPN